MSKMQINDELNISEQERIPKIFNIKMAFSN